VTEKEREYFSSMWRDKAKKKKKASKDKHYSFTVSNFLPYLHNNFILGRSRALGWADQRNQKETKTKPWKNSFSDKMTRNQM